MKRKILWYVKNSKPGYEPCHGCHIENHSVGNTYNVAEHVRRTAEVRTSKPQRPPFNTTNQPVTRKQIVDRSVRAEFTKLLKAPLT